MQKKLLYLSILSSLLILTSCGSSNNNNSDPAPEQEQEPENKVEGPTLQEQSNLSTGTRSEPQTVYFDLDANAVVDITDVEAEANSDWDISFNRTKVSLNRFAETPVSLFYTGNANDFYDDEGEAVLERFNNASAETEFDAFDAFDSSNIPTDAQFETDTTQNALDGFYNYNRETHVVTPNAESYYVISSDGAYSKINVTALTTEGRGLKDLTIAVAYQATGTDMFMDAVEFVADASGCSADLYLDLDTQQVVMESDEWDVRLPCQDAMGQFELHLADNVKSFSGESAKTLEGVTMDAAPHYAWVENETVLRAYKEHGDPNSGYGWGEYGINGGHTLWPNYATYVITTGAASYKFQITGYYDTETDASGSYSFRFQKL